MAGARTTATAIQPSNSIASTGTCTTVCAGLLAASTGDAAELVADWRCCWHRRRAWDCIGWVERWRTTRQGRQVNATGEPCDRKGHARFDGEALETGALYGSVDLCA